jgi:pimeloyl-ACP methyl ester carboxylesterase
VILVGHSLGGAVATHLCALLLARRQPSAPARTQGVARAVELTVCGLAVLDAVEGTALASIDAGKLHR